MISLEIKLYIKNKLCCQESVFLTSLNIHQDCSRSVPCRHRESWPDVKEGKQVSLRTIRMVMVTRIDELNTQCWGQNCGSPPQKKVCFATKPKLQNVTLFGNRLPQMSSLKMKMSHNPIGLDTLKEDRYRERMAL